MKVKNIDTKQKPIMMIDKELNKYSNKVLFPEKLAKANAALAKSGLPPGLDKK